ncbi:unnamed protein product [Spirodela intermedia]|uniref:Uncharacterized protein n=1 Tax=Spirodela intermedia TaxID=51605 RepID=A0A7I8L5U1_SPIIN|nr:unnamed protein product [Spirodela intermedia]
MASAVVNTLGLVAPEGFLDLAPSSADCSSYGWVSPRASSVCSFSDDDEATAAAKSSTSTPRTPDLAETAVEAVDLVDFEFLRLDDPMTMLPADELFSDGKLVPLQGASPQPTPEAVTPLSPSGSAVEIRSLEPHLELRRVETEAAFSSKGPPRCSSRWRDLLRLKKAAQIGGGARQDGERYSSSSSEVATGSKSRSARSLKHFLHRNRKASSIDPSLNLPLLGDSELESVSLSSRLSLSSSSPSAPDHEDVPRLSLDSEKSTRIPNSLGRIPPRVRLSPKPRTGVDVSPAPAPAPGGRIGTSPMRRMPGETVPVPADSPRMNSSGKVVFHNLERSTSSPSTFNGGSRVKHRGMERSYSANVVRVTPVLNVPVCSLRGSSRSVFGFSQLFSSPQKKDPAGGFSSAASRNGNAGGRSGKIEKLQ